MLALSLNLSMSGPADVGFGPSTLQFSLLVLVLGNLICWLHVQ